MITAQQLRTRTEETRKQIGANADTLYEKFKTDLDNLLKAVASNGVFSYTINSGTLDVPPSLWDNFRKKLHADLTPLGFKVCMTSTSEMTIISW